MQHEYNERSEDLAELSDHDLYFEHVIRGDHELLAMDLMLGNALAGPVED